MVVRWVVLWADGLGTLLVDEKAADWVCGMVAASALKLAVYLVTDLVFYMAEMTVAMRAFG